MQHARHTSRRVAPAGFTLTELLIVISIMVLLFTVAVPSLKNLLNAGKVEQGLNVIGAGVSSVRTYAGLSPAFPQGSYQGVAVIFTPANEMRFTQHISDAKNGSNEFLYEEQKAGYADIDGREYLELPLGTGVVGIARNSSGIKLLAPPFAVRFNANGQLIARISDGTTPYAMVYYDGNYNDQYATSGAGDRPSAYDPHPYDPIDPSWDDDNYDEAKAKHKLPFDAIETVVGVIVFDKAQLKAEVSSAYTAKPLKASSEGKVPGTTTDKTSPLGWLLDEGTPIFFNRHNGARIKP